MTRYVMALTFALAAQPAFAQTVPAAPANVDPHTGHALSSSRPSGGSTTTRPPSTSTSGTIASTNGR